MTKRDQATILERMLIMRRFSIALLIALAMWGGFAWPLAASRALATRVSRASHAEKALSARSMSSVSHITEVTVTNTQALGAFNGSAYQRIFGTVSGVVVAAERLVGLSSLPKDVQGNYHYTSQFELITPVSGQPRSDAVLVEAENRGSPLLFNLLQGLGSRGDPATIQYPVALGNGFLPNYGLSYARVQWETGISAGVPSTAQGVGEVIVRDFGRLLRGRDALVSSTAGLPRFHRLILGGYSQGAFFVDTFLAEGFNSVLPMSCNRCLHRQRVFDGAFTLDGAGNWLAINQLNGNAPEFAYVQPNGVPLSPSHLLSHPHNDPFLVNISAYTDFYRLRASLFEQSPFPANLRQYDIPATHSQGCCLPPGTTLATLGCNIGGKSIGALNPIDSSPYIRNLMAGLAGHIGVRSLRSSTPKLPPSTLFNLGPAPAPPDFANGNPALPLFNYLPGAILQVPLINADGQPMGGVAFPDASLPLGQPDPVSIPPVVTTASTKTCGNRGGWQPFSAAQLAQRYGSVANYLSAFSAHLDRLIATRYVLPLDRQGILSFVEVQYNNAPH